MMHEATYLSLDSIPIIFLIGTILLSLFCWTAIKRYEQKFLGGKWVLSGLLIASFISLIAVLNIDTLAAVLEFSLGLSGLSGLLIIFGLGRFLFSSSEQAQAAINSNSITSTATQAEKQNLEQTLNALKDSEKRFELLSELTDEGIVIHRDGRIIETNEAFCRHTGYDYLELIGLDYTLLFAPEEIEKIKQRVAIRDKSSYESVFIHKSGTPWHARIQGKDFIYRGKLARVATVRNISLKKQMQEKLQSIEQHRQQIINNTPIILFALNPDGIVTLIEGKISEKLKLCHNDFLGQTLSTIFADNPSIVESTQKALEGEAVLFKALVDGACFEVQLKPILDNDGNLQEVSGIAMDISERYQAEQAMQSSDQKYKAIVDGMAKIGEGILIIDENYQVQYMNSIMVDWFGDQVGKICYKAFGGDEGDPCNYCQLREVIENRANVFYQIEQNNGKHYEVVGAPIVLSNGKPAKLEIIRDVSEAAEAAKQIRLLSHAVEQSGTSVIITNNRSEIEYINKTFSDVTGYKSEDVIGKKTSILQSGQTKPEVYKELWGNITQGKDWHGELLNKRKNGELYWERSSISPFYDSHGKTSHYLAIKEDITEQKRIEEDLRLSATVFNNASEAVMITDKDNKIQKVNKAFTAITGYQESEVIGLDPSLLSSGRNDESFYQEFWDSIEHNGSWEGEIWNRRKNGDIFPEWLSITRVNNDMGEISHYVSLFSDISKRKKDEERIFYQANYDDLTGLPNRNLFNDRLAQAIEHAEHTQQRMALLFIDLDRFKNINDSMGHLSGDQLLKETAERLRNIIPANDTIARLGSDEFTAIFSSFNDIHTVEDLVRQMLADLETPYELGGIETFVTASIGIAVYPEDGTSVESLLVNADNAMYRVKETGRNGYHFFTQEMNIEAHNRQALDTALHLALENQEFILHYQPIVDLASEQIIGTEALIRWQNPEKGLIPPNKFIPLAEDSGLIVPMGEWALLSACREAMNWPSHQGIMPSVSVNFSIRQFQRQNVLNLVNQVLSETKLPPERLNLEITESLLVADDNSTLSTLHSLREMGISLSIDDFGTGYSSLGYLKRFPISHLKIDRSFIMDITSDPESAALVDAILSMAKSLGLKVVAEGVETREQVDFLKGRECDRIQGYYFGRPLPPEELIWYKQAELISSA